MLAGQNKISKHKAQIQQRIAELQNKLRQPARENQTSNKKIDEEQLPYRRAYAQQQVYIQPKEVTALRERELNVRQSRNKRIQPQPPSIADPQLFIHDNSMKNSQRVSNDRIWNKQFQQRLPGNNITGQQIYYPKRQQRNSITRQRQNSQQNNQLYGLMEQILNNQRNLQKQIGLLRSEWLREQNMRKEEKSAEPINSKNRYEKPNPIISFQEPQSSVERAEMSDIFNRKPASDNNRRESQIKQNLTSDNFRNVSVSKKNQQSYEQETFGINSPDHEARIEQNRLSSSQLAKDNKQSTAQKNRKSGKKVQQQQIHQKLSTLIKTQKGKNQRLIVSQRCKSQFWKQVQNRILASQNQYKQSVHRNNRHEQDHLINTNQLQKKLKDDLVSKVYSQCNTCLYK